MKALYYSALAPGRVPQALAPQAYESLMPFVQYLNAAQFAAKEREARSRCRWEAVPPERPLRLRPLDSLLELSSEGACYRVEGVAVAPPDMPLFVGAQYRPVKPERVESGADGIVVWLAAPIDPSDMVFWAGLRCTLRLVPPTWPATLLAKRADGTAAQVLHRAEVHGALRLVVEGAADVAITDAGGQAMTHRALSATDGATRLRGDRTVIAWAGQLEVPVTELPDTPVLLADNGVRWSWADEANNRRRTRGVWIQLLAAEDGDSESTIDPRAAFCDEGVRDVRTQKGPDARNAFRVLGFRRDTYRLELDRLPPEGSTVFVPANVTALRRQLQSVKALRDTPLPHHRELLTLCEDPARVQWAPIAPTRPPSWFVLNNDRWEGTLEQRDFVMTALATPDFAFLEGPPGSGKTHAICELVLQLIARGLRVLLCSTTHVAVDNVLERLVGKFPQVEAVRIGLADRVDPRVRQCQLDEKVDALTATWRAAGALAELNDQEVERAATSVVLAATNLTCGTTTGILSHPYIRRGDDGAGVRWPHFDVLIVDEASKTTFQEFLVPALLATRWIIVGDVRQLPPFTDPRDLEASLADVRDQNRLLTPAHQRACLLRFQLGRQEAGAGRVRWLIEEPAEVLDALVEELEGRGRASGRGPLAVRVCERTRSSLDLALSDLERGQPAALRLLAADWILVTRELRPRVEPFLPAGLLQTTPDRDPVAALGFRFRHWYEAAGRLNPPVRDGKQQHDDAASLMRAQQTFLREETWASEVGWRLGRVHQLSSARSDRNRARRQEEVDALMPESGSWAGIEAAVDAIRDVGVRSVIESLRVKRVDHRVRRNSALTEAIPDGVWSSRAVLLTRQHRMHADISDLPRKLFYDGSALRDANTLDGRDAKLGWDFLARVTGRRLWFDVDGIEQRGINHAEIAAMARVLEHWRRTVTAPRLDGRRWEIACLAFYARQEQGIRDMLRQLTGMPRAETRFSLDHTDLTCGTVDRFQGREADLVLLSMRNVSKPGHIDSPNRLNVGITRARFLLVILGNRGYFRDRCRSDELNALATDSRPLTFQDLGGRR
jgi:hypothetical protein